MDHAAFINGDKTEVVTIEMIENHQVTKEEIKDCFCVECGGPATLVQRMETLFFRAFHEEGCSITKDGRKHKTHRIASNILIDDVTTMIAFRDKDPNDTGGPKEGGSGKEPGGGPGEREPWDDQDFVNKYGICHIHTVGGMYKYPDIEFGDGTTFRDYILDERALYEVRQDGIDGPKIAIVKRVHPSQLEHEIKIPEGYTLFADRFTPDVQDAVFFLVKLSNKAANDHFREKVMSEEKRDRHKDLLLLGKWKRCRNEHYIVFKCTINSRCCHFFNYEG